MLRSPGDGHNRSYAAGLPGAGGTTTPQVMIIFIAASTLISSSTTTRFGTITRNPAVAFKADDKYTPTCNSPVRSETSGTFSAVMNPMLHAPGRGYSIITTLRK